jgi:DNA replication factor GINS
MYDQLFEAWQKEKENAEIQPLPRGFYADLAAYLRKIREEKRMLDERTVKGKLLLGEEENVKRMAEELVQTRYEKLMTKVSKWEIVQVTALAEEEKSLYRDAASQADNFQAFTKKLLQGRLTKEPKPKTKPASLMIVRILQEIPEIIGSDMKTYGPFKPEDIASLPKENARTLIKQGAATEVEAQ